VIAPDGRDPIDARLLVGDATNSARRLHVSASDGASRDELLRQLERLRHLYPVDRARRLAAALRMCRGRVVDLDNRARQSHKQRVDELAASRADQGELRAQAVAAEAQLPVEIDRLLKESLARWPGLLDEVGRDWEARIEGCSGMEQLRAEVAAIEDGSAHRLAVACDELRDGLTIQLVRLVLELSHPPRQQLYKRRLQVARDDRSPKLEEALDELRKTLPASLEEALRTQQLPAVSELMSKQGFFTPLFRTLAREKKGTAARLRAQLDELRRAVSDLLTAGMSIAPKLAAVHDRVVGDLLAAHERWIDHALAEEETEYQRLRALHDRALVNVAPLEQAETRLLRRLESFAVSA
jgi:hypothetical protein